VLDDGRGNEGKEAFFLWDTSKYSHPSIWIKKRLTFDARKVDFVMFLLNEYKKARQFGMIMSDQPVEPNKSVEASIFTPINENIDGLEV
jgi:hypothetical protein